jgi:hypothetical protein
MEPEKDLYDHTLDRAQDVALKTYETGKGLVATQVNNAIDYMLPELDNLSNPEAKQELVEKATKISLIVKELAGDPEVQKLAEETGEAFEQLTTDLMDVIEPGAMNMTERGLDLVKEITLTTGRTLGKTGVDLIMSVLGEIPGVGGVIDLGVTTFVAFNGLARNLMIGTENILKMVTIANKLTGEVLDPVEDGIEMFQGLQEKAEEVYRNIDEQLQELDDEFLSNTGQNTMNDPRLSQPPEQEEQDTRMSQPVQPSVRRRFVDRRLSQQVPPSSSQMNQPYPRRSSRSQMNQPYPRRSSRSQMNQPYPMRSSRSQMNQPYPMRSSRSQMNQPYPMRSSRSQMNQPYPMRVPRRPSSPTSSPRRRPPSPTSSPRRRPSSPRRRPSSPTSSPSRPSPRVTPLSNRSAQMRGTIKRKANQGLNRTQKRIKRFKR